MGVGVPENHAWLSLRAVVTTRGAVHLIAQAILPCHDMTNVLAVEV